MIYAASLFFTANFGFSRNDVNFIKEFNEYTLYPSLIILFFLFLSIIILFLQQYKNSRFGYVAILPAVAYLFIFYNLYNVFPIIHFVSFAFAGGFLMGLFVSTFWLVISAPFVISMVTPFYVLIRLIKEDFFKKR
jgi:hypothetical protein